MTRQEIINKCSNKRPICDSGWEGLLAEALVDAGAIKGKKKKVEDYYEYDFEWKDAETILQKAIEEGFSYE